MTRDASPVRVIGCVAMFSDDMLDVEERPAEDEPASVQMYKVHGKPREKVEKEGPVQHQEADEKEEVQRMEDAEAGIPGYFSGFLEFVEIAKHSPDVEPPAAQHIEDVMVNVDQDASDGEPEELRAVPEGEQEQAAAPVNFVCCIRVTEFLQPVFPW